MVAFGAWVGEERYLVGVVILVLDISSLVLYDL